MRYKKKQKKDEMDSSSDYEIYSHSRNAWLLIRVAISVVGFGGWSVCRKYTRILLRLRACTAPKLSNRNMHIAK